MTLRNDNVIPRLSKGKGDGVKFMCAMQAVSWQTGDVEITDYPECSAQPLSRLVQTVNDWLASKDDRYLSPEDSITVLDLGWLTVGTADAPDAVKWRWLADVLTRWPAWGPPHLTESDTAALQRAAQVCVERAEKGSNLSLPPWTFVYGELTYLGRIPSSYLVRQICKDLYPGLIDQRLADPSILAVVHIIARHIPVNVESIADFVRELIHKWRELTEAAAPVDVAEPSYARI